MRPLHLGALLIAGCGATKAAAPRATLAMPVALAGCSGIHAHWREIKARRGRRRDHRQRRDRGRGPAPAGAEAIVSLSGERFVQDYRDIIAGARKVKVPALYAGARQDGFTDGARQQDQLHAAMGGRLVQVGGIDHGTDLLQHPQIAKDVSDFVSRWTAG